MSDLIDRQAAIDRINKQREHLKPDIDERDAIGDAAYRVCAEFIGRLLSAQRWIPVSEKFPEEKEIVLITFDERVEMGRMRGESWEWLFESGWNYWVYVDNVTAWMPLPEPYKEEE